MSKIILNELLNRSDLEIGDVVAVIDYIRPKSRKVESLEESTRKMDQIIHYFKENERIRSGWSNFIRKTLTRHNPEFLYRERSFFGNTNLFNKFWKLLRLKILPKAIPENAMDTLLDFVFKKKRDYLWVQAISKDHWERLFEVIELEHLFDDHPNNRSTLINSITLISYRIAALGMDSDLLNKMPVLNNEHSPFFIQNKEILKILDRFDATHCSELDKKRLQDIFETLEICKNHIIALRDNKRELGISMHLTYISKRLLQQIDRIQLLLNMLYHHCANNFYHDFTRLFTEMLEYQEVKNSIRKLLRESVNLVAFEIVEHTAQKGEKYIAGNAKEYWRFILKAMLGGLIIAFFASFKIKMDAWQVSPLGEGLIYGLNYAACFVLVYFAGGIIATKQPAMTASSIVQAIDKDKGDSVHEVSELITRVSRSQFASFIGNLALAFPMAMLISNAFPTVVNDLLLDSNKTDQLLEELQPFEGGAYYYAAIAGIILSLAGLISGYFDNKVIYSNIPTRIEKHPFLVRYLPQKWRNRFALYIKKNSGALAGNIALGFMLGLAGSIGFFTGLPLDIRHVAFSSANFGFAMEYLDFNLNTNTLFIAMAGVLGIGLINFIVSFGLTFWIAMRSRNTTFGLFRKLALSLLIRLITKPHHFLFPVKV